MANFKIYYRKGLTPAQQRGEGISELKGVPLLTVEDQVGARLGIEDEIAAGRLENPDQFHPSFNALIEYGMLSLWGKGGFVVGREHVDAIKAAFDSDKSLTDERREFWKKQVEWFFLEEYLFYGFR